MLWDALTFGLGYNAALVTIGATLLGISAGITGSFIFLRKRALVTDAIAHSTLPGVALAFILMVTFGFDGRSLVGLLIGSTAGMLFSDAVLIAVSGAILLLLVALLRRPMIEVAFDESYAKTRGLPVGLIDISAMGLALAVTVVGLKIVGLILIVALSLSPILIGVLAGIACALPGNFLVLRKQALIGDAISHVVLPGIVVAFLLTGAPSTWPMLFGAAGAAIVAVVMIEAIRRLGKIEAGAAMGVVFTALFAFGILLLEQTDTSSVHLDVEHALYGNLESLIWLDGTGWSALLDPLALAGLPEELPRIAVAAALGLVLVVVFWRPLTISTFDEVYAVSLGYPVRFIGFGLVVFAAIAAVAAFDAVGSIIVISMFICPAATARLMTDDLKAQVVLSVVIAALAAVWGYVLAGYGPMWIGSDNAVSAAGMIATVLGIFLAMAAIWGPRRKPNLTATAYRFCNELD